MAADSPLGVKLRRSYPKAHGRIGSRILWLSGGIFFALFLLVGYVLLKKGNERKAEGQQTVTQTIAAGPANGLIAIVNPPSPDAKSTPTIAGMTPEQVPAGGVPLLIKTDGQQLSQGRSPFGFVPPAGTVTASTFTPDTGQQQYGMSPVDTADAEREKAEMAFEMKRRDAQLRPFAASVPAGQIPPSQLPAPQSIPDIPVPQQTASVNSLAALGRFQNPVDTAAAETRAAIENKHAFLKDGEDLPDDYLHAVRTKPLSEFELQQDTKIPATMEVNANSDIPGTVTAIVRKYVYDSLCGKTRADGSSHCYTLIPAGSRLIGEYNTNVAFAQSRLQIVWTRIIFPDTSFIDLGKMSGYSADGTAGFKDKTNNHWRRLIGTALLTSALTAGFQISQNRGNQSTLAYPSTGQVAAASVGMEANQIGGEIMARNANIPPSITIRAGYNFEVVTAKDVVFSGPYQNTAR